MVDILATPFLWVVATIALYAVAYWGYGKCIDRNVWRSDAKKATPAHMYMDGVEYFLVVLLCGEVVLLVMVYLVALSVIGMIVVLLLILLCVIFLNQLL